MRRFGGLPDHGAAGVAENAMLDGPHSWRRLAITLAIVTIGGSGMWCVVVALPDVQADFGVDRSAASLPYTCLMIGLAAGGILLGRLSDRFGIVPVSAGGGLLLGLGFLAAAASPNLTIFALVHGLLIGPGCSASFGPLMADISFWFNRRRGIAVALVASGNYLAGTVWPPLVQTAIASVGWRVSLAWVGAGCLLLILPLALALRTRHGRPSVRGAADGRPGAAPPDPLGARAAARLGPGTVQTLLAVAGLSCCVAMSMPQVHIVAYCSDLGYGPARGAEMLAVMLGAGIVSRLASGLVADQIGGMTTLLVGSTLQCLALVLYMLSDSLVSLYVISALFGLFQGGIVPSYAMIVREVFPAAEAGQRIGICVGATLVGMALGGWLSGWIFDRTGSYQAAFANGIGWNLLNLAIVIFLSLRITGRAMPLKPAGLPA